MLPVIHVMVMVLNQAQVKTCSYCHGSGHVSVEQNTILGRVRTEQTCPKCEGSGQDLKNHVQLVMVKGLKIKQ